MTTIQVEVQVSSQELLKAVKQLDPRDLDVFVSEVLAHKAQLHAPMMSKPESELLNLINRGLPTADLERYNVLREKLRDEVLLPDEHTELLQLSDRMEEFTAERAEALVQLANLRHVTLPTLLDELGIHPASDA